MYVLGLTGSIGEQACGIAAAQSSNARHCHTTAVVGMGKSTVAGFFAKQGVPVLGADEVRTSTVHESFYSRVIYVAALFVIYLKK